MKCLFSVCLSCAVAAAAAESPAAEMGQGVALFDTGRQHGTALSASAIAGKAGWQRVTDRAPAGDACAENNRITVCFRKAAGAADLYYRLGNDLHLAASLTFSGANGRDAARITALHVRENSGKSVHLNLEFETGAGKGGSADFAIQADRPTVDVVPGDGLTSVLIRHASEYVVMPDFCCDDIVFEARTATNGAVRLPADNLFLLHMIDGGNAMLMCNWLDKAGDVPVTPREGGEPKVFGATALACGGQTRLWISVLAAPAVWHATDSAAYTIYEDKKMEWKVPFEAAWRLDYRRADKNGAGLIDSWWNLRKDEDGQYRAVRKHPSAMYYFTWISVSNQKTRGSWSWGLGGNIYPFYTEGETAVLRIPKLRYAKTTYADTILIFPWLRADGTPKDVVLPIDVLSATLGSDWQKILDIRGLERPPAKSVYPATCGVTEQVKEAFDDHKEKEKRAFIVERLRLMDTFVRNHRERIEEYLAWADGMAAFYEAEKTARPALADLIERMQSMTAAIPKQFEGARDRIKTPEYAATLSQKLIDLIESEAEDKVEQCDRLGREIRTIGGGQDGMLGSFRSRARQLRQTAGLIAATDSDPARRAFAGQVRTRTREILRVRFGMEGK
ncbi:MAG: hypothetical protein JXR37_35340 [Kiritimatiellae bacterium]|nr:hypothetical protein [Kiritimatiellia bacterium]